MTAVRERCPYCGGSGERDASARRAGDVSRFERCSMCGGSGWLWTETRQRVHVGATLDGVVGFFTGNTLALPLDHPPANREEAARLADAYGFELE